MRTATTRRAGRRPLSCLLILLASPLVQLAACGSPAERSRAAVEQARAAQTRGDLLRAEEILRARLAYAPRDVAATVELARQRLARDDAWGAARILRELPHDAPIDREFRRTLARAWIGLGNLREAIEAVAGLEAAGDLEPELLAAFLDRAAAQGHDPVLADRLPPAWRLGLAQRLIPRGEIERAAALLAALPAGEPGGPEAVAALLDEALARDAVAPLAPHPALLSGPQTSSTLRARHRLLAAAGRWSEAAAVEDRFLAAHPDDPARLEIVLAKARRLVAAGAAAEGLALAEEAARLDPTRAAPLVQQALALAALGREAEARRALERALAADPTDPVARELWDRRTGGRDGAPTFRISLDGGR